MTSFSRRGCAQQTKQNRPWYSAYIPGQLNACFHTVYDDAYELRFAPASHVSVRIEVVLLHAFFNTLHPAYRCSLVHLVLSVTASMFRSSSCGSHKCIFTGVLVPYQFHSLLSGSSLVSFFKAACVNRTPHSSLFLCKSAQIVARHTAWLKNVLVRVMSSAWSPMCAT